MNTIIPKPLKILLKSVTYTKNESGSGDENNMDRKCADVAHCLIYVVRSGSFLSPILIGVDTYIRQNVGTKNINQSSSFCELVQLITRCEHIKSISSSHP